jgi:hypothetical protein
MFEALVIYSIGVTFWAAMATVLFFKSQEPPKTQKRPRTR